MFSKVFKTPKKENKKKKKNYMSSKKGPVSSISKKSGRNRKMYAGGGYSKKRMAYGEGGVVQYADIKDKVKKCDAKAGMNTMKYKYES